MISVYLNIYNKKYALINIKVNKFLCAILTSDNIDNCIRAVNSFPPHANIVIVCNTLKNNYYKELTVHPALKDLTLVQTQSNGTPGKGKQSVIEYFLSTDFDYLIQIDGDDFLYPEGYDLVKDYVNINDVDVLGLLNEDILIDDRLFVDWRNFDFSSITSTLNLKHPEKMEKYFRDVFSLIVQEGCVFNRIICVSRKGAENISWNDKLPGTEDVLLSAQLKYLHLKGELTYHLLENSEIYLYNKQTNNGTGFKALTSDPDFCREHFFSNLTSNQISLLNKNKLPYAKHEPKRTKFSRMKYVKKLIK